MSLKFNRSMIFLFLYVFVGLAVQVHFVSKFRSLPSPIFGGDYYYQLGTVYHVVSGGSPLSSSSMLGGIPGYSVVYPVLVSILCFVFRMSPIKAMFVFSYLSFVFSVILWFLFFKRIFEDDLVAVVSTILTAPLQFFPIFKYTPFAQMVVLPLFLLLLYNFYLDESYSNALFLGLIYGVTALANPILFAGSTLLLLFFFLSQLVDFYKSGRSLSKFLPNLMSWFIVLFVSFPIAMLYWYKPVFVYHMHSFYDRVHMDTADFHRFSVQISFLFSTVKKFLFNFSNLFYLLRTFTLWFSLYAIFDSGDSKRKNFLSKFLIFSFIICFSYFLTEPFLNINLIPSRMVGFTIFPAFAVLLGFGLNYFLELFEVSGKKNLSTYVLASVFVVVLFFSTYYSVVNFKSNIWFKTADNPLPTPYLNLQNFILKNTKVNDVFLSTKELSFMINSLTGRKLLVNRWAQQNDPYINLPQRDLDAAIILYGNNDSERLRLLKKYKVKYLYWDANWMRSEFSTSNNKVVGVFDPLLTFYSPANERILLKNNISFIKSTYWVDPAERRPEIRKFNLLIVSYENYRSFSHPFSYSLDKFLTPIWNYTVGGKTFAVLYKVNLK